MPSQSPFSVSQWHPKKTPWSTTANKDAEARWIVCEREVPIEEYRNPREAHNRAEQLNAVAERNQ